MTWLRPPGPVAAGLRIGLLGGSFNPAHGGHLYVTDVAMKRLKLDYVWWLVSPQNPLKPVAGMAPLAQRLAAARTLASRHPRLLVTALEQDLGTRYTIDTIAALTRRFPHVAFTWLMGSDNLEQFHRWRQWDAIPARLPVAVVVRPGSVLALLRAKAAQRFRFTVLDGRRNELSATAIRAGIGGPPPAMLQ